MLAACAGLHSLVRSCHLQYLGSVKERQYLGWGLELCSELCQLGLELPKMVLCGLQEQSTDTPYIKGCLIRFYLYCTATSDYENSHLILLRPLHLIFDLLDPAAQDGLSGHEACIRRVRNRDAMSRRGRTSPGYPCCTIRVLPNVWVVQDERHVLWPPPSKMANQTSCYDGSPCPCLDALLTRPAEPVRSVVSIARMKRVVLHLQACWPLGQG